MNKIDKHIIKEIASSTATGFAVYTAAFMLNNFVKLAEIAVKRDVGSGVVLELLLYSLPSIVALTIPMAFLVGLLVTFSRMSADSEIIAMQACGVSQGRLLQPALLMGAALTFATMLVMLIALPWGNATLSDTMGRVFSANLSKAVEPRVFFENIPQFLLYVDHSEPNDPYAHRVFLTQDEPGGAAGASVQVATFARRALLAVDPDTRALVVRLDESETHVLDLRHPEAYERSLHHTQTLVPRHEAMRQSRIGDFIFQRARSLREMTLGELFAELRAHSATPPAADPEAQAQRGRGVRVEIHKKFSIPAACLVFAVLGLPLGISNARGGKLSGFVLSIGVFVVYWIFLWGGERMAVEGVVSPAWAMWGANVVLLAWGGGLFWKRARGTRWRLGERIARRPFLLFPRRRVGVASSPSAPAAFTPSYEGRWRHLGARLLDRYVLRSFVALFGLVTVSFLALFLIIEAVQLLDDVVARDMPAKTLAGYLFYVVPQFAAWTIPLGSLLTAMLVVSLLARRHEITAMHAAGVSAHRIAAPLVFAALALSAGLFALQDFVLPDSNRRADQIKDTLKGRPPRTYVPTAKRWIFGEGGRLYHYAIFNPVTGAMQGVHVFSLDGDTFSVRERVFARRATWSAAEKNWRLEDGWVRRFDGGEEMFETFAERRFAFSETPEYFGRDPWKSPETMNFLELHRYIEDSRQAGYQVRSLVVNLHKKFSFAMVPFLLALIGIPIAFRVGRRGALFGFGAGIALAALYYVAFVFFTTMGQLGVLPPVFAAWAANVLFAAAGVIAYWTTPT